MRTKSVMEEFGHVSALRQERPKYQKMNIYMKALEFNKIIAFLVYVDIRANCIEDVLNYRTPISRITAFKFAVEEEFQLKVVGSKYEFFRSYSDRFVVDGKVLTLKRNKNTKDTPYDVNLDKYMFLETMEGLFETIPREMLDRMEELIYDL